MRNYFRMLTIGVIGGACVLAGACDDKSPSPATATPATGKHDDHDHDHDHAAGNANAGHDGPLISLGKTTAGPFALDASRGAGEVRPGRDVPVYVVVTPDATDPTAKVAAVRSWIGTADAKGSVKSKAEPENPAELNHWHAHAEVPSPLPADARLWFDVESQGGKRAVGGTPLNP
jgi:hypothetical protein